MINNSKDGVSVKIALVVSTDTRIRNLFSKLFRKLNVPYLFERDRTQALIRVLSIDLKLIIVDLEEDITDGIDFLKIILKLRPRLYIIMITTDTLKDIFHEFADNRKVYWIIKHAEEDRMQSLISDLLQTGTKS